MNTFQLELEMSWFLQSLPNRIQKQLDGLCTTEGDRIIVNCANTAHAVWLHKETATKSFIAAQEVKTGFKKIVYRSASCELSYSLVCIGTLGLGLKRTKWGWQG